MRLVLEIDLDRLTGPPPQEVRRILRYWGGNMAEELLESGRSQDLYDSAHVQVGTFTVTG